MALTTDVYWDIDGVPLQTYAKNITTWGGDLQAPPSLRGEDLTIPYRPGEVFQTRRPKGRSITFNMWVIGADDDGKIPTSIPMRGMFEQHFKNLRNLFWNQGKQFTLTRRWKDYTTNTVKSASAKAVFAGGLAPVMNGQNRATFSVELYLPDPFFYGAEETITFPATNVAEVTSTILGDYETTVALLTVNGARNNIRLTNNNEGVYVNIAQDLAAGQTIQVDVDNWTAVKNPGVSEANIIGSVTSFGHEFWFVLRPGSQKVTLSSSSGTGTATLKYRPRYI